MVNKTSDKSSASSSESSNSSLEKRLGWFQIHLLTLLWTRNMYGLELQTYLRLNGYDVSVGQLYPALKRLEKDHLISSYEEVRKGANRKYYNITPSGRTAIMHFVEMFRSIFNEVIWQKTAFIPEKLTAFSPITPGMVILDISFIYPEVFLREFAPRIGPTGHYFLASESDSQTELLELLIDYVNLDVPLHVVQIPPKSISDPSSDNVWRISLPDHSVDLIFSIFRIPLQKSTILTKEVARLLKLSGYWLIVSMLSLGDHILQEMETSLRDPKQLRPESDEFIALLELNHLKIRNQGIFRGLLFQAIGIS